MLEGEVGYVTDDPNQYKIGDGVHAWNELPLRGFDGTLVHELGDSQTAAMSQQGVTKFVESNRVLLSLSPIIMYGKAYSDTDGVLQNFDSLDCTHKIELPYGTNNFYLENGEIYSVACFNYNDEFIGNVNNTNLLENTRYISISFLKEKNIDYSKLVIIITSPYQKNEDSRNKALHISQGEMSPLKISFSKDENNSITIKFDNNTSFNTFDNEGNRININFNGVYSYTLSNYYSLLLNSDDGTIKVETFSSITKGNYVILAYNDNGKISKGFLCPHYINERIDEQNERIENLETISLVKKINSFMYGKAYNSSNGIMGNFPLLDSTYMIEIPRGIKTLYLNCVNYYDCCFWDENKQYISAEKYILPKGMDLGILKLSEGTKYIAISFLKSSNVDYDNVYLYGMRCEDLYLSSLGFSPIILRKKAYSANGSGLQTFDLLDSTPLMEIPDSINSFTDIATNFEEKYYGVIYYDKSLTFIKYNYKNNGYAIPNNAKYFSIAFLKETEDEEIDFTGLLIKLKEQKNDDTNALIIPTQKKGKKYYLFGDSITYWDSRTSWYDPKVYMVAYPSYIRDVLGAEIVNAGIAGNTSNQITTRLLSTDLSDAYALTYMAGANDLHASVPIGTIGEFNRSTYIGNLETAVQYVLTNYPLCKMYFLSPLWETNGGAGGYENYAEAMDSVAKHYHIPILRWDLVSCIGELTKDTFYVHENTTRLHPNNEGHKRLADSLIPFLQNY